MVKWEKTEVFIEGSHTHVKIFDQSSKMMLSTVVYLGENYLPASVRASLEVPFTQHSLRTYLKVDEEAFCITLHYLGAFDRFTPQAFQQLLAEFTSIAEDWRVHLDDRDRRDRVYVRKA